MIFMSDEVTSENHWHIISRVIHKSLIMVTNVLFLFLTCYFMSWIHNSTKKIINHSSLHCCHGRSFLTLHCDETMVDLLWGNHGWSVTSRECEVLALWRHIPWLFFQIPISLVNNNCEYIDPPPRYSWLSVKEIANNLHLKLDVYLISDKRPCIFLKAICIFA